MREELKANLTRPETWLRGLFILLFGAVYGLGLVLLAAVVVFQFISTLVSAERNAQLLGFARSLAVWLYQITLYATFNRDERPWPFDDWPAHEPPSLQYRQGDDGH